MFDPLVIANETKIVKNFM